MGDSPAALAQDVSSRVSNVLMRMAISHIRQNLSYPFEKSEDGQIAWETHSAFPCHLAKQMKIIENLSYLLSTSNHDELAFFDNRSEGR